MTLLDTIFNNTLSFNNEWIQKISFLIKKVTVSISEFYQLLDNYLGLGKG